jgi:hypothetical protein
VVRSYAGPSSAALAKWIRPATLANTTTHPATASHFNACFIACLPDVLKTGVLKIGVLENERASMSVLETVPGTVSPGMILLL